MPRRAGAFCLFDGVGEFFGDDSGTFLCVLYDFYHSVSELPRRGGSEVGFDVFIPFFIHVAIVY